MHAFLDRKGETEQRIGFVNEFVLGTFVGDNLKKYRENFISTERFIDFLLTAYLPRSSSSKKEIYSLLRTTILEYLSEQKRTYIDNYLSGCIRHDLKGEYVEDIEFRDQFNDNCTIKDCFFFHCEFYNINFEISLLEQIHFLNCTFHNCNFLTTDREDLKFFNCDADPDFITEVFEDRQRANSFIPKNNEYEKHVLERFWPAGKERFMAHRRISTLRLGVASEDTDKVDTAIDSLIRRGIIIQERGKYSVELNLQYINEIKEILGR